MPGGLTHRCMVWLDVCSHPPLPRPLGSLGGPPAVFLQCRQTKAGLFLRERAGSDYYFREETKCGAETELDVKADVWKEKTQMGQSRG